MFESILFRPGDLGDGRVDVGAIAEAMVFCEKITVLLNEASLKSLVMSRGIDDVLAIASCPSVKMILHREVLATHHNRGIYDYVTVERMRDDRNRRDEEEIVSEILYAATGRSGKSRRSTRRFLNSCEVRAVNDGFRHPGGVTELAREDASDRNYSDSAIRIALDFIAPTYSRPFDWRFKLCPIAGQGFTVDTNLDFAALTASHRKSHSPALEEITPAICSTLSSERPRTSRSPLKRSRS